VDPDSIFPLVRPYFANLIGDIQEAFADFDAVTPLDYRLSIEAARPMAMSERVHHFWRQRHGASYNNPVRVHVDRHRNVFLIIESEPFSVGLRLKKLKDDCRSSQHISRRQTSLRREDCFPEFQMYVAHVILGFRYAGGANQVVPCLTDISLSSEYVSLGGEYDVRWRRVIWDADEGAEPVRPIQLPLLPPPEPVYRPRRPAEGEGGQSAVGADGQ
jgi:hypothetical protein